MSKLIKTIIITTFFGILLFSARFDYVGATSICNNGPNSSDSNNCGTSCHYGDPWSKYEVDYACYDLPGGWAWWNQSNYICARYLTYSCSTGSKCIGNDTGLRYGYCDCTPSSSIYAACCDGPTAKQCTKLDYDGMDPPEGTCSPYEQVNGTSCNSDGGESPPSDGGSSCLTPYNNACPKGFVLSGGCCVCP